MSTPPPDPNFAARKRMVETQIQSRGVRDPAVLQAMLKVPRHCFVPDELLSFAHEDGPLPIGLGQTLSQPYIVAAMTECLELQPDRKVLEIGTGSGYQSAVLASLVKDLYTVEILEELSLMAEARLKSLGFENIHYRIGDGHAGWPDAAPFDAILVTAAPERIPKALLEQLAEGGRMVLPVGSPHGAQRLIRAVKQAGRIITQDWMDVRFVPMVHGT